MQIFVEVPPTSIKIPSKICRKSSAPTTLAAGPDKTVIIGLCKNDSNVVTPPSPFMIIIGTEMYSFFTADSTKVAVFIAFGRMLALMVAVNVRIYNP